VSHAVGSILPAAADGPTWVALVKLFISMGWLITIGLNPTMGVAWHRFLAFVNIWTKRHPRGRTSLGALQPIRVGGKPLDFENIDDLDEDAALGVGTVEDFTWKGLLDFSTCTECGRCQSQCPAWNTGKPLSPKLLILNLRDHAQAKAPWCSGRPGGAAARRRWRGGPPAGRAVDPTTRSRAGDRPGMRGPASPAEPASSSARWTSSTSTTRRHAPLPGADSSAFQRAAGCSATRAAVQPGDPVPGPSGLGQGLPFEVAGPGTSRTSPRSTTCSGSAARAPARTGRRRPRARSPSCCTWRG
jgi:hypothetical protein